MGSTASVAEAADLGLPPGSVVLVTRSPHQSSELVTKLSALGLEPVLVPAIELALPSSFDALDAALADLASFDWLIFTSANAVEAFHRRMESAGRGVGVDRLRIAAIGPATARALESIGRVPELIPPQAVAESLTEALLPRARGPDGGPTRFLLMRAEDARDVVPEALNAAGARVTVAPAYRTVVPAGSIDAVQALLTELKTSAKLKSAIGQAAIQAARTIAVVSPSYLASPFGEAEW